MTREFNFCLIKLKVVKIPSKSECFSEMEVAEAYTQIADEFSRTRYSVWKGVREYLDALYTGVSVADIGCGNGKNMLYRGDLKMTGVDVCEKFLAICVSRGLKAVQGSVTAIPFADETFDHAICIAVIHHFRSKEERCLAIQELARILKPGGTALIYVWAFEQPVTSKRKFVSQDEMVPFQNTLRFYHLYSEGELEKEISAVCGNIRIQTCVYELGNWYAVIEKLPKN